jgi:hypothetical protein
VNNTRVNSLVVVVAPDQVLVGIETERGPWVQALLAAGYVVYPVNPMQVARYRERHSTSGAKSDPGDAHLLAEVVRLGRHHAGSGGHLICTYGIGTEGEVVVDAEQNVVTSGGTDVWVTFDDTDVLAGWPARADYPTEEALYAARSAWLNANPDYIQGTAYPHPDYDDFSGFPTNYDVGVVELDEAAPVTEFAELAPHGTAEALAAEARNRNSALVENVGYGIQAAQPRPMDEETRYKSTSRIVEVNGSIARGGNLHT